MRHFLGNKRKIKALHFWQTPNYFGLDFEFPPQNENFSEKSYVSFNTYDPLTSCKISEKSTCRFLKQTAY